MPQIINTNIASLNSQRSLNGSQNALNTALQRLSSGLRINSAKDDAAGLAISERMTSQIRGLNQAARNANDGISLAQTAEGALTEIGNNLQRIRELAVQSANATNSASDRAALQAEVAQLVAEIDRVATQTDFNGTKLLDGNFSKQAFQVGANAGQTVSIDQIASARSSALGKGTGFTLQDQAIGTVTVAATTKLELGAGRFVDLGELVSDAKSIAAAINNAGTAGLNATANATEAKGQTATAIGTGNGGGAIITINNVAIKVQATETASTNVSNALAAINAQSSVTGVRAVDNGTGLDLIAQDGRNIELAVATGTATGADEKNFGLSGDAITRSTINVTYSGQALGTDNDVEFTGAIAATTTIGDTGTALNAVDISDVAGANAALAAVDAALTTINSSRADLGAIQNRFSSVITNLQTSAENLSASRSRIQDADFAAETAALTRAQILQQAGVAMLAQANALPNNVLSLLR